MKRLLASYAIAAMACVAQHPAGGVDLTSRDCDSCHHDKLETALQTDPLHPQGTTACANCHRINDTGAGVLDWKPALLAGTHNEAGFVISSGPHHDVLCADCHDPSVNPDSTVRPPPTDPDHDTPINVSCTGCHTGDHELARMATTHRDVDGYDAAQSTFGSKVFCRDCHQFGFR